MDPLPIRMLNEHLYCPRLFYLMHVQGQWSESGDTVEGTAQHERSRQRQPAKPPTGDAEPWPAMPRNLHLSDEELGLVGKLDALEENNGDWTPVEYKHSAPPHDGREIRSSCGSLLQAGAWPNDQIQLAAQGLLLRSNGYKSEQGYLYYRATKQRVAVPFTEHLLEATREELRLARDTESGRLPPPLVDSPKCPRCSLHSICLPDETNWLLHRIEHPPVHINPSRDDAGVLYVSDGGSYVGKRSDRLTVKLPDEEKPHEIPWKDVLHVTLAGPVQISTQAVQTALEHGRGISWLTAGGKYLGGAYPPSARNLDLLKEQFRLLASPPVRLQLSRSLIFAKIANSRTIIRRNSPASKETLTLLRQHLSAARRAESLDALMGVEGLAARAYFPAFAALLKDDSSTTFDWLGRSRRPPKDPINALLSLAYSLLARDVENALRSVGLEPMAGYFHAAENGRPALALDMMEPFRPLIAESVVLRLVNSGQLTRGDFWLLPGQASLKKEGRKRFFAAYETRMSETIRHPKLRYSLSYRRVLELEARLFARYLEGELPDYIPLMTR